METKASEPWRPRRVIRPRSESCLTETPQAVESRVWGLEFRVWGSGVQALGSGVLGFGV